MGKKTGKASPSKSACAVALDSQNEFLFTLVEAAKRMGNITDPAEMFRTLAEIVRDALKINAPSVFTFDRESSVLRLVCAAGCDFQTGALKLNTEDIPRKLAEGQTMRVDEKNQQAARFAELLDVGLQGRFSFEMLTPVIYENHLIALLALEKRPDGADYTPEQLKFLDVQAKLAAVNIHNCLLYEQSKREKKEQTKIIHNLSLLYNIGRALNHIDDLKKLLRYILRQALAVAHAEKGSIMLYDAESDCLQIRVIEGLADEVLLEKINNGEVETKSFKPGEGVAGQVFKTGKPILINRTDQDDRFVGSGRSFANSIACIPMIVYKDVIGVINVTNKLDNTDFTNDDVNLLRMVADQAAVAINKAQLWEMAVSDSLTGLYIRRYFMVRFTDEHKRAKRYGKTFSVVMCDIDYFKNVNDTYGHQMGDMVLRTLGKSLQENIREVDVAGRYGGEEFVLLLPETPKEGAKVTAERLRERVAQLEFEKIPGITISLGIATFPEDADNIDQLIQCADKALYQAKHDGRNRVCAFSPDLSKA